MKRTLPTIFFEHASKDIDKWEQYLAIYEREMARFVVAGHPVELLEIGVQNGGSLELWSKFLPFGSTISGVDIDESIGSLRFNDNGIKVFIADAADPAKLEELFGASSFDVIVDDGSHLSKDIIVTFKALFSRLKPGGIYIVEDLHCSYYQSHDGGFRDPKAPIEWFKTLADALNYDHIAPEQLSDGERFDFGFYNRAIASVCFYDSVVVIEKLTQEKNRPYRRVYSGSEGTIAPTENWLSTLARVALEPMLFGHAASREIDRKLLSIMEERQIRITQLEGALYNKDREINGLQGEVAFLNQSVEDALENGNRLALQAESDAALLAQRTEERIKAIIESHNLSIMQIKSEHNSIMQKIQHAYDADEVIRKTEAAAELDRVRAAYIRAKHLLAKQQALMIEEERTRKATFQQNSQIEMHKAASANIPSGRRRGKILKMFQV